MVGQTQSITVMVVIVAAIVVVSMVSCGEAKSIGEMHSDILWAKRQEAFLHRRQPEYAESNHVTAEETLAMRKVRRKQREMLKAMGIEEENPNAKMSLLFRSSYRSPRVIDEESVNEHDNLTRLFEGDIVLTKQQEEVLETPDNGNDARQQAFMKDVIYHWDLGIVPYVLDRSLNKESKNAIFDAMDEMEEKTNYCLWFVERDSKLDNNYIRFISDYGCWSEVGMVGGVQELSIENTDPQGYTCAIKGIVMHEIFHAIGRFHEQNRYDRDDFVTIAMDNVEEDYAHNFEKQPASVAGTQGIGYDFDSIMHYGAFDFALDPREPVIIPKTADKITGQRDHLTEKDVNHIYKVYNCDSILG